MADASAGNPIWDDLQVALWFGVVGIIFSCIAWQKGYFHLKARPPSPQDPHISFLQIFSGFLGYMGIFFLLTPLLAKWILKIIPVTGGNMVPYVSWLNFSTQALIIIFLFLLYGKCYSLIKKIFKSSSSPIFSDIGMGILSWAIAFPIVICLSEFLNAIVIIIYELKELPEQLAIQYLKSTLTSPFYLFMSLFSIIVLAPVVEEFMFRGLLQTWLKDMIGTKTAIIATAVLFSFFHFSPSQGLGNIPIIGSLFLLALFLGFIYERQRSLFSSIAMHACFNTVSIFNLIFLKGDI